MEHSGPMSKPAESRTSPDSRGKKRPIPLIMVVSVTFIFISGVVVGLSATIRFARYFTFTSQTDIILPTALYAAKCDKDYLSIRNYTKPKQLKHNMTDDELFWRASMIPKRAEYPYKRVPKLAFMFLTRGDLPLVPLWERFFRGHENLFSVYIHSRPNYKSNVPKTSPFYGRQIPSKVAKWGSVSLLDAEKRLLANALLDFSNERFILLSESCIPIFDFPTVYNYLISSKHSFVESFEGPSRSVHRHYKRKMFPDIRLHQWRKGSEWFEMHRELAVNIVADLKYYAIFREYCKPTCIPDEHYIPTYLNMFHGALNSNRSITWVSWSTRGSHPARFERRDITAIFIQSIRDDGTICMHNFVPASVCFLFARKFAPSALETLLNISSTVMGF